MIIELKTELAVRETAIDGTLLTSPEQVGAYMADLKRAQQECFVAIALNIKKGLPLNLWVKTND